MFGANSFAAKLNASSCIVLASSVNPLDAKSENHIFTKSTFLTINQQNVNVNFNDGVCLLFCTKYYNKKYDLMDIWK